MRIIDSEEDIAEGLDYLARRDKRLSKIIRMAGPVPLRRRPAGFPGLARIIVGQQLSIASAEAIWGRFVGAFPGCDENAVANADDDELRAPGLSAAKIKALRAAASACRDGLDLQALAEMPSEDAHRCLTGIKGIGPWSADIYLLFCLGYADIFPAGDLALRKAMALAFDWEQSPSIKEVEKISVKWSPWRGVAARLFWAYYRVRRERAALPL